jgi:hypothetical protein
MTTLETIEKVLGARQLLYALLVIAIVYPLLSPIGLPIGISSRTRAVYDYINTQVTPGSPVLIDLSYEMAARGELEPQVIAVSKQLFDNGHKIVFMGTSNYAPLVFSLIQSQAPDLFVNKEYGTDYVFLGYIAGGESAVTSLAKSISGTIAVDNYGEPISSLDMMKTVDKATDFGLVFIASAGTDTFGWYIRQFYTPYNSKLLFGALSVIAPSIEPYVGAGQAIGMLQGQRQAAEYELLVGRKGLGSSSMDAQSFAHGLILVFVVLGNIVYIYSTKVAKGGEKK